MLRKGTEVEPIVRESRGLVIAAVSAMSVFGCGGESAVHGGEQAGGGQGGSAGAGASGGSSGASGESSGGSSPECRVYATSYDQRSTGAQSRFECEFSRESLTLACNDGQGVVTNETWATIEDAVAENRPVGNYRAVVYEASFMSDTIACSFRFDTSFDARGRATSIQATPELLEGPCAGYDVSYDAWDTEGRPTHGSSDEVSALEFPCSGQDLAISYDDVTRSVGFERTGGSGEGCFEVESTTIHDANGLPTLLTSNGAVVYEYTTLATAEICLD